MRYRGKHRRGDLPWVIDYLGRIPVKAHGTDVTDRDVEVMVCAITDAHLGACEAIVRDARKTWF